LRPAAAFSTGGFALSKGGLALSLSRTLSTTTTNIAWRELKESTQYSWRNKPCEAGQVVRVNFVTRKATGGSDGFGAGEDALDSGRMDFRLGSGKAFGAFEEGVPGMRVGDVRRIRAPHTMAYGVKGKPPAISPFEEVVFDVTLTGCVHQMHIEVLEVEPEEHSVENIVAAVGRTAQQAAQFFGQVVSSALPPAPPADPPDTKPRGPK
jgi:hypothetical protein